ncbi:Hemolysin, contains CBS domains [Halorientalis persicus]|uniref:Hemolysin, contains CBS domains n=1 Tax=Halorientalis persicus TaxID=1367881 RepID=A0A1H8GMF1_9EURY|nr:hemolysin family protein [Halorientalis persicus]SEN44999.1 Hemolysin, contains CBS domains [Halorientalis persicus]
MTLSLVTGIRLLGGVVLLLGNGFFVTTEFAMTRVRQFEESEFQGNGRGLERAWNMTERLEIFLTGCQVGITICSVGLGVVAEPAVTAVMGPLLSAVGVTGGHTTLSVILALTVVNLSHVIVGEQAPTYLGIERAKFVAGYGSGLLYAWTKLMYPVILAADWVAKALLGLFGVEIDRSWTEAEAEDGVATTRAELRRTMGESLNQLGVPEERRTEVINALDIGQQSVSEIMVDRDDVVALSTTDDFRTNMDRIDGAPYVRFPLLEGSLDAFVGVVYAPTVLHNYEALDAGTTSLEDLATPPLTVPADTTVSDFIDRCQAENQELALVTEDDTVVGLLTATDAFEEITGELDDPMDLASQ